MLDSGWRIYGIEIGDLGYSNPGPIADKGFGIGEGTALANLQSHQFGKDHGLRGINDCAFQVRGKRHKTFYPRTAEVRAFQLGSRHIGIFKFTGFQHGAAQIAAVEVGLSKVAGVELAFLEGSKPKRGKTSVSLGDQEILAFSFNGPQSSQPAIDKFRPRRFQANRLGVGKVTLQ